MKKAKLAKLSPSDEKHNRLLQNKFLSRWGSFFVFSPFSFIFQSFCEIENFSLKIEKLRKINLEWAPKARMKNYSEFIKLPWVSDNVIVVICNSVNSFVVVLCGNAKRFSWDWICVNARLYVLEMLLNCIFFMGFHHFST